MNTVRLRMTAAVMTVWLLWCGQALATTPDADIKPLRTNVDITGVVEDDYSDGLLITTSEGVSYLVVTPEEISLEQEEAFHTKNKGRTVTLTGDVYKDDDGSLSLLVTQLPRE